MSEKRRIGRFERSISTRSWWRLVVAGLVTVLAVVIGSGIGIDAWFLGFFAVILGCLLIVGGVGLGLAHLVARHRSVARA